MLGLFRNSFETNTIGLKVTKLIVEIDILYEIKNILLAHGTGCFIKRWYYLKYTERFEVKV